VESAPRGSTFFTRKELAQLEIANEWASILAFIFVLGVMIFVHDWSLLVAKLLKIRVDVFSLDLAELFGSAR